MPDLEAAAEGQNLAQGAPPNLVQSCIVIGALLSGFVGTSSARDWKGQVDRVVLSNSADAGAKRIAEGILRRIHSEIFARPKGVTDPTPGSRQDR